MDFGREGTGRLPAAEKERLFIETSVGPTEEGLALIAYLQWLGTWEPAEKETAQ